MFARPSRSDLTSVPVEHESRFPGLEDVVVEARPLVSGDRLDLGLRLVGALLRRFCGLGHRTAREIERGRCLARCRNLDEPSSRSNTRYVDAARSARLAFSLCRSGGTGRRAGFRSQWAQARGGSSPPFGTLRGQRAHDAARRGQLRRRAFIRCPAAIVRPAAPPHRTPSRSASFASAR